MEERLRPVLGLDDHVGGGEAPVEVAPVVTARLGDQRPAPHGLLRIEQRLQHLPLRRGELERRPRGLGGVRRDGRDRLPFVGRLRGQDVEVVRADDGSDLWCGANGVEVEP